MFVQIKVKKLNCFEIKMKIIYYTVVYLSLLVQLVELKCEYSVVVVKYFQLGYFNNNYYTYSYIYIILNFRAL